MNAKQAVYDVIRGAIANHPRSLQKRIGPSEIGTPCDRRIGYKLLGQEENPRGDAWKPTVGTAVHGWLEKALEDANLAQVIAAGGRSATTSWTGSPSRASPWATWPTAPPSPGPATSTTGPPPP